MQTFIQHTSKLLGLKSNEEGATMVEYGLMVALIAVVCLISVTNLGSQIRSVFQQVAGSI